MNLMFPSARRPLRSGRSSIVAVLAAITLLGAFSAAASAAPGNPCPSASCLLVFVNQPNTTKTSTEITDGYAGSGDPISVKIVDRNSGATVDTNATVTLSLAFSPSGGTLSTASRAAVAGVATFDDLSVNAPGPYKLRASSAVASNNPVSAQFMVSNIVTNCDTTTCSFTQKQGGNSYTVTPKTGTPGADYVTTLNLPGLNISCDFAPYNYPAARQPNTVWYVYDDGGSSVKTNVIVIDKSIVQITPENGASKYRVCYASPETFKDRFGNDAPADTSSGGPSEYFGAPWYMGLLPDCAKKNPVAPCVVSWTASSTGQRIGTFLTPKGDPSFR
jgi:hypothetical protein